MKFYLHILLSVVLAFASCGAASATKPTAAADSLSGRYLLLNYEGDGIDLVPKSTREHMIAFREYNTPYHPDNKLHGSCELLDLTATFASLRLTGASTLQLCALPKGKKQVAAVVYTVDAGNSPDSQLTMLDDSLRPLKTSKFFKEPTLDLFLSRDGRHLRNRVPFLILSYQLSPTSTGATLTATLNIEGSMTEEDYSEIRPYIINKSITYTWDGRRFKLNQTPSSHN